MAVAMTMRKRKPNLFMVPLAVMVWSWPAVRDFSNSFSVSVGFPDLKIAIKRIYFKTRYKMKTG
jgi:hypothetical protein